MFVTKLILKLWFSCSCFVDLCFLLQSILSNSFKKHTSFFFLACKLYNSLDSGLLWSVAVDFPHIYFACKFVESTVLVLHISNGRDFLFKPDIHFLFKFSRQCSSIDKLIVSITPLSYTQIQVSEMGCTFVFGQLHICTMTTTTWVSSLALRRHFCLTKKRCSDIVNNEPFKKEEMMQVNTPNETFGSTLCRVCTFSLASTNIEKERKGS